MKAREIGGYFELERTSGKEYYPNLIAVNNARNGLLYLLKIRKIKKIYIPYFLCDSISKLCEREGYEYEYYSINNSFLPIFNKELSNEEYLYVVNFYGQLSKKIILNLKKTFKNIILDNVQAFFQKPIKGIDAIYSCRKFFGVPDGGYVHTDFIHSFELEKDKSKDRMKHLLGRFEGGAIEYYQDFKENDLMFENCPLLFMSDLTHNILCGIEYKAIIKKRNANYKILNDELGSKNALNLIIQNGPYCYPFYCKNGMEVKKKLAEKKIYIATLWPNVLNLDNTLEKDYAENILPLPCDQRYTKEDMNSILEEIRRCQI